jgi:hypothetical protein
VAGKTTDQGWKLLGALDSPRSSLIQAELFKVWNELYQTRSSRLFAVRGHVLDVVWWIVFFSTAITAGYTNFVGYQSFRMHMV